MNKKNILFLPWRDYNQMLRDGFRTREAQILKQMIDSEAVDKVLCVNRPEQPKYITKILPAFTNDNIKGLSSERRKHKKIYTTLYSELWQVNEKLYVLNLKYHIPNPKGNKLERLQIFNRLTSAQIQRALLAIEMNSYITWCVDLTRAKIAENFKTSEFVFDAIDNLLEHDQNKKDSSYLKEMYRIVNKEADVVFTVSTDLRESLFHSHPYAYYVPNGIDLRKYKEETFERPADLPKGNPIIGYVGLLQERIDIELLKHIALENSNMNFVFVGPILSLKYFEDIRRLPNVYFLGAKHHDEIPKYLRYFDICIIPHKVNKFTKSMNPLKLYEYLAAKKEVITTPVPPSEDFSDSLHVAREKEEFSMVLQKVNQKPFQKFSEAHLSDIIKQHDWKDKFSKMINIINEKREIND